MFVLTQSFSLDFFGVNEVSESSASCITDHLDPDVLHVNGGIYSILNQSSSLEQVHPQFQSVPGTVHSFYPTVLTERGIHVPESNIYTHNVTLIQTLM